MSLGEFGGVLVSLRDFLRVLTKFGSVWKGLEEFERV